VLYWGEMLPKLWIILQHAWQTVGGTSGGNMPIGARRSSDSRELGILQSPTNTTSLTAPLLGGNNANTPSNASNADTRADYPRSSPLGSPINAAAVPRLPSLPSFSKACKSVVLPKPAMLAMIAVGVGVTFSAPVGGVLFAVELMIPSVFDLKCYWGCFGSAVVASLAMQILAGVSGSPIRPFVKADLNDGQYESFRILLLRTLVDAIIAVFCGVFSGAFIIFYMEIWKELKEWRLQGGREALQKMKQWEDEVVNAGILDEVVNVVGR